ncbi:hypothetical protein Q9189_005630 [Teloschistes chrysophthalmus]
MYPSQSKKGRPETSSNADVMVDVTEENTDEKLGTITDQRGMCNHSSSGYAREDYTQGLGSNGVLSLPNGGTAGSVWMFLITFAPPEHQQFLSYTVGYLCVLGWHASLAGTCYATGQQIQAIIVLANSKYTIHTWQTALLAWAVVIMAIFFNTVMFQKLPLLEGILVFAHVLGFCAFIVVLCPGVASLVGISAAIGDVIGADSSVHLAEELKNASWILPRSMMATAMMNYVLGFITIITLVFCLGDLDSAINSPTGQPYVQVLLSATRSPGATIALVTVMLVLLITCAVNSVTTSSRQLWSFARDGGPPCSAWLARVRPAWDL